MNEKRQISVIGYRPKGETLEKTMSLCTCIQDWSEVGIFNALKNTLFRSKVEAIERWGREYERVELLFTFEINIL